MENLVIEHKDLLKKSIGYFLVVLVLVGILLTAGDQFKMSIGTAILIAALVIEFGMAVATLFGAYTQEIMDPEGITVRNFFGSKTYAWKDLDRFEILWDYEGKRLVKKEEVDAPYILLKFANPKMKFRFDYREDIDLCIRVNYGQPHKDDWTNIGK